MIVPRFIRKGDKLGVTAPSFGVNDPLDANRFSSAKAKLSATGRAPFFIQSSVTSDYDITISAPDIVVKRETGSQPPDLIF